MDRIKTKSTPLASPIYDQFLGPSWTSKTNKNEIQNWVQNWTSFWKGLRAVRERSWRPKRRKWEATRRPGEPKVISFIIVSALAALKGKNARQEHLGCALCLLMALWEPKWASKMGSKSCVWKRSKMGPKTGPEKNQNVTSRRP